MFDFCIAFDFFKRTYSDLLIGTQGGSDVSSSVGIQDKASNVFLCKRENVGCNFMQKRWPAAMLMVMLDELKARTKVVVHEIEKHQLNEYVFA